MPLNDENQSLPVPPAEANMPVAGAVIPAGLMDDVPEIGEAMEKGTYHFRADSFTQFDKEVDGYPQAQPSYMVQQVCQDEGDHMGRRFTDFIDWVTPQLIEDAAKGHPKANTILRQRLSRAKSYALACGADLSQGLDFKAFLESNPECRIQISVRPRKTRNAQGQLEATGEMQNGAVKYIPLTVPVG